MTLKSFLAGFVRDPISKDGSSTRLGGLLCIACGCALAFRHSSDGATTIGTLIVGGGVALLLRKRAEGGDV